MKSKPTVLLVDDDIDSLHITMECFEREGICVLKATSAFEAISILAEHRAKIDIIISDLNMPNKSGKDFLMAVRTIGCLTPFFFYTASRKFSEQDAERAGANGLFYKPASTAVLLAAIKKSLARKGPRGKIHAKRTTRNRDSAG